MSNQATADPRTMVKPWGIEADHPRNADLWIKSIPGMRLRGAISGSKPVIDQKTGRAMLPVDQVRNLGPLPQMPGMRLIVNPAKLEYVISDPLFDDEERCKTFSSMVSHNQMIQPDIKGLPPRKGKVNEDDMKTLCREMLQFVQAGEAKVCTGAEPSLEEIDALPGDYLLNPGILTWTSQPKYEKDFDAWARKQSAV